MAEKKATIVIKKITVVQGGAHGGAWKVAFADFMTAMMAFFLVMWLVSQTNPEQKKALSDYFSTPSVIEYNFQNYGAELTLEKLFLDLVNDPLKTLTGLFDPMDQTPNIMGMGMKKVVMSFIADQLGDIAKNVEVSRDQVTFEIPDTYLFERGTAEPNGKFMAIMEKIKTMTAGLEDSDIVITSLVYNQSVPEANPQIAKQVAQERVDILTLKVKTFIEQDNVDVRGRSLSKLDERGLKDSRSHSGWLKFELKQKESLIDGRKPRPLDGEVLGKANPEKDVYNNFVNQLATSKKKKK